MFHALLTLVLVLPGQTATTYFKPSIHGWPFHNFDANYVIDNFPDVTFHGHCGGMSWTALDRFYDGVVVARQPNSAPAEGTPLCSEIQSQQVASVEQAVDEYNDWPFRASEEHDVQVLHGIGYIVQNDEWPELKGLLDAGKPTTIHLWCAEQNKIWQIPKCHQVVAYKDSVSGSDVTIWIYDCNYPNDDNVYLHFLTGQENCKLSISHSKGDYLRGFFVNNAQRHTDAPSPTISSFSAASKFLMRYAVTVGSTVKRCDRYELALSWNCSFIPYFDVSVDGQPYTTPSRDTPYANVQASFKQGTARCTVDLVGGNPKTVLVSFVGGARSRTFNLNTEAKSLTVIPYMHERRLGVDVEWEEDALIPDAYADSNDVVVVESNVGDDIQDALSQYQVYVASSETLYQDHFGNTWGTELRYHVGYVAKPVYCDFIETGMVPPTSRSGTIWRTAPPPKQVLHTYANMPQQKALVFGGFKPPDYPSLKLDCQFTAKDAANQKPQDTLEFAARSLLVFVHPAWVFVPPDIDDVQANVEYLILGEKWPIPPRPGTAYQILERARPQLRLETEAILKRLSTDVEFNNRLRNTGRRVVAPDARSIGMPVVTSYRKADVGGRAALVPKNANAFYARLTPVYAKAVVEEFRKSGRLAEILKKLK